MTITRRQLDWLLGPKTGAKDLGEVGCLPLILIPAGLLLVIAGLRWVAP